MKPVRKQERGVLRAKLLCVFFFFVALKSRIVSRRPTALLSPFVSEPQSQSACKIDELVHGWVTMGDSQSEGRGRG